MPETEHRSLVSELSKLLPLLTMLAVSMLAFNREQRAAIVKDRDEDRCQAPFEHKCNGDQGLELHHIRPQRYAKTVGISEDANDVPENGISLCKNAHTCIHPDQITARRNYHIDKQSYHKVFDARQTLLDQRKIYWMDRFDRIMAAVAAKRSDQARARGWVYPYTESQAKKLHIERDHA